MKSYVLVGGIMCRETCVDAECLFIQADIQRVLDRALNKLEEKA